MFEDDDDEFFESLYEDGHWEWNNKAKQLVFVSDLPVQKEDFISTHSVVLVGTLQFNDDIDLIEQQRFRKRIARKTEEEDVVTLQDVKDVALLTAPTPLLSPAVIRVLHLPLTERFLRALILFCQYYLQIADEMSKRTLELDTKIRTRNSDLMESVYRENLEDLRLLVAKEYSCMLIGGEDYAKYHHMGAAKKRRSLSNKDSMIFESMLRISIQIVWLALGRKSFNQIELEVNRIFKSAIFNSVEHRLNTNYEAKMSPEERLVLLGKCINTMRKTNTKSPLFNEVTCSRPIDYRLLGLGTVKQKNLSHRLRYFERVLIAPELLLAQMNATIGIIGLPRSHFDIMLREIKIPPNAGSTSSTKPSSARLASKSRCVSSNMRKSTVTTHKMYPDVVIPDKDDDETETMPSEFPTTSLPVKACSSLQRRKWLARINMLQKRRSKVRK